MNNIKIVSVHEDTECNTVTFQLIDYVTGYHGFFSIDGREKRGPEVDRKFKERAGYLIDMRKSKFILDNQDKKD